MTDYEEEYFDGIKKQFEYLHKMVDTQEIKRRSKRIIKSMKKEKQKAEGKMARIKSVLEDESINIEDENYLKIAREYAYNLPKDTNLATHTLCSGFFLRGTGYTREVHGRTFNLKEISGQCMIVERKESGINYIDFTSNVKEIQSKFAEFTPEKLLEGWEYFIYCPEILFLKLSKEKERYEEYFNEITEMSSKIKRIEEMTAKYTKGDTDE